MRLPVKILNFIMYGQTKHHSMFHTNLPEKNSIGMCKKSKLNF